jgi:DNA-binding transcriptional ArsR family regulator
MEMGTEFDFEHPDREELELAAVLHAFSDPLRLEIVRALSNDVEPRKCGSFEYLGIVKSTRTHHFRVLREAGIIRQERKGTAKFMTLRRDDLDARFPGLLDAVLAGASQKSVAIAAATS